MTSARRADARMLGAHNVLVCLSADAGAVTGFAGTVVTRGALAQGTADLAGTSVYLCGGLSRLGAIDLEAADRVLVIADMCTNLGGLPRDRWQSIDVGQVPIRVHGLGVLYPRFFDPAVDYFKLVTSEHVFQSLTESTKPSAAHRTGIYLTPVEPRGDELHFRLLRCSTNLAGPTENFRASDRELVSALNAEARHIFDAYAPLNHVLAQAYHNTPARPDRRQTKARISAHADKTKDMPADGVMAFCTFYDSTDKLSALAGDPFDRRYKGASGLTRLRFRRKESAVADASMPEQFTVTLYPHSAFFMPLSTNRLYTHEIQASALPAELLPTRLGYVVRCADAQAVHAGGATLLETAGTRVPLEPATPESVVALRALYASENRSTDYIDYGGQLAFSMNQGDYLAPTYHPSDELAAYTLPAETTVYDELLAASRLEEVAAGRHARVIVRVGAEGAVPIVRTTTRYRGPARAFGAVHDRLAQQIRKRAALAHGFNNLLVELYTDAYTTMAGHCDQALDLADDSAIAIFSCYRRPESVESARVLVVEGKEPGAGATFEIPLLHNRVVVFSLGTNRRFRHKIIMQPGARAGGNDWLGVTFRTSKTLVHHRDRAPTFVDGAPLTLATEDQARAFFQLRRRENHELAFRYPPVPYSISESDLLPVERGD